MDIITFVPAHLHTQPTLNISSLPLPPIKAILEATCILPIVMTPVNIMFYPLSELSEIT